MIIHNNNRTITIKIMLVILIIISIIIIIIIIILINLREQGKYIRLPQSQIRKVRSPALTSVLLSGENVTLVDELVWPTCTW
jgi:hypothetical protein